MATTFRSKMMLIYIYLMYDLSVDAKKYSYIVVGSGSAGSVVANRLSKDPSIQVLLLEAGGKPSLIADVPLYAATLRTSPMSWNYTTVPLKNAGQGLNDRISFVPAGKVLGGSSTINYNSYTRGNRNDYNWWAAQGAVGWDWKGVFPYFLKHEDNGNPCVATNGYHNVGGEQPINYPPFYSPMTKAYLESAEHLGYRIGDVNGRNQTVFTLPQGTIKNGRRWSGLKSFIEPIVGRRNIRIATLAHVTKILIDDNNRAYGVLFVQNNKTYKAIATEEVIVCAGVFNSAQLLMLSGIGPKKELETLNIPIKSDLPVGKTLQHHMTTFGLLFKINEYSYREGRITTNDYNDFLNYGIGPLTSLVAVEAIGFINGKHPYLQFPDIEIIWLTVPAIQDENSFRTLYNGNQALWRAFEPYSKIDAVQCFPIVLHPKSNGKVSLRSANPYDPPIIDPNYYSHPSDIKEMVEAMKFCLLMASQEPMKKRGVRAIQLEIPGCEHYQTFSDEHLACVARVAFANFDHYVGTCKMGNPNDSTTVVDPMLRVKGIHSLRVVDASVMPSVISGHTHAPTAMIGEKGADMILRDLYARKKLIKSNDFTFEI